MGISVWPAWFQPRGHVHKTWPQNTLHAWQAHVLAVQANDVTWHEAYGLAVWWHVSTPADKVYEKNHRLFQEKYVLLEKICENFHHYTLKTLVLIEENSIVCEITYECVCFIHTCGRWVWDCEFSSDSNFLVTGSSDNTARSWNLALGDTICHFNGHHKAIISVALCDTTAVAASWMLAGFVFWGVFCRFPVITAATREIAYVCDALRPNSICMWRTKT